MRPLRYFCLSCVKWPCSSASVLLVRTRIQEQACLTLNSTHQRLPNHRRVAFPPSPAPLCCGKRRNMTVDSMWPAFGQGQPESKVRHFCWGASAGATGLVPSEMSIIQLVGPRLGLLRAYSFHGPKIFCLDSSARTAVEACGLPNCRGSGVVNAVTHTRSPACGGCWAHASTISDHCSAHYWATLGLQQLQRCSGIAAAVRSACRWPCASSDSISATCPLGSQVG